MEYNFFLLLFYFRKVRTMENSVKFNDVEIEDASLIIHLW